MKYHVVYVSDKEIEKFLNELHNSLYKDLFSAYPLPQNQWAVTYIEIEHINRKEKK